jgi:hypothetical protein
MGTGNIPNTIRTALLCLGFLVGVGGGIFIITRKRALPGWLMLAGFGLFGLDRIFNLVYTRVLIQRFDNFVILSWVFNCISGPLILLGILALVAATITAIQPNEPKEPAPEKVEELPPPS